MRSWKAYVLALGIFLVAATQASATSILVSLSTGDFGYGYGFSSWTNFTAALDAASGGGVDTTADFTDLSQMLSYDALMLDQRWLSGSLTATEISNLSTFIATGRRVLMVGENSSWTSWNNQILGIVGSSFVGSYTGSTSRLVLNELTAGAPTLDLPTAGGAAAGGTALYDFNFATLWGASNNVLTVLDVNVWDDFNWAGPGQGEFGTNVAEWLATSSQPVPEPATLSLLGIGLVGLAVRARQKQSQI